MVEMRVGSVRVEMPTNTPVVLLTQVDGDDRVLPIFIGTSEATSIAYALRGIEPPRPLTHDLFANVLVEVGASVERIVISDVREGTYFAELHIRARGELSVCQCRPSDGIAVALRTSSPIIVSEEVLELEGVILQDTEDDDAELKPSGENADELLSEFRQFIEEISPDDFQR